MKFPFLFGGTFIEAAFKSADEEWADYFPSFSEGLSLRHHYEVPACRRRITFPFLFGGTFIEAPTRMTWPTRALRISLPFRRDFH